MEVATEEVTNIKLLETVEDIQNRREQVLRKYSDFKKATEDRRKRLEDAKKLYQFKRDADEVELWINDKLLVASDECYKDQAHLQVKIQKHATFEAEVQAHSYMMETLEESGEIMINEQHYATDFVQQRIEELRVLWALLLQKCKDKEAMLVFTQKKVTYFLDLDQLMSWIVEKTVICEIEEDFRDVDHVEIVQKKFDEFNKDLNANEVRLTEANETCTQLEVDQHPDIEEIQSRNQELNDAWTTLKGKLEIRRQKLTDAHEIHNFYRETIDTINWINEKDHALSSEDVGADLAHVAALQRNHENLERDLAALADKVSVTSNEADELKKKYPVSEEQITEKQEQLTQCWNDLQEKAKVRKKNLLDSYNLQKFLAEDGDYEAFVEEMMSLMKENEGRKDHASAESLLERHAEHKGIIDASEEGFDATVELADMMMASQHDESELIGGKLDEMKKARENMMEGWDLRKKEYDQCMELQLFNRDIEQMETIMVVQENFLCSEPNADSVDGVDNLSKKQEDFENVFQAQEEKVKAISAFAEKLSGGDHYALEDIKKKQDRVCKPCTQT
jgi:spectrin alpha